LSHCWLPKAAEGLVQGEQDLLGSSKAAPDLDLAENPVWVCSRLVLEASPGDLQLSQGP
jgi:hypothetical protein